MDLKGKIVVLTGATSGIGLATAEALCRNGAHLIGIGRSAEKCEQTELKFRASYPGRNTRYLVCDFSSLKNIRKLAENVEACLEEWGLSHIDVLLNNAGTFTSWYVNSAEGFEMQFAVNHLAPFLLTHLMMPLLKKSTDGRVITVSSGSHYHTKMHWKDVLLKKHYHCLMAYKQSKLANVLFTKELNRRLGSRINVKAYAADPGLVNTEMGLKATSGLAKWIWSIRKNSGDAPHVAADSLVFLCKETSLPGTEIYYKACKPKKPSRHGLNEESAMRLWQLSEKMCGIQSEYYGL